MHLFIRLLDSFSLAVWGLFFTWLLTFGRPQLSRLLNPSLWWLVGGGAVILLLFAVTRLLTKGQHDQHRPPPILALFRTALLLLPFLYFPLAAQGRFGALTMEKRAILPGQDNSFLSDYPPPLSKEQRKRGSKDTPLTALFMDPEKYTGKSVTVLGMVFRHDKLPPGVFMCYRFLMVCCAADANPVFAMVDYDKAAELPLDGWVEVTGPVRMEEKDGMSIPRIQATSVTPVTEPAVPYLFF
jgi:uncharacterized repeat protein (TIGR03943 family)